MPSLSFVTLDVFTRDRYAGNPLAVVRVPSERDVSTEQMQAIAREFNLSETIFVHDSRTGKDGVPEWRVRIFLTRAEIPFAGHPTIGCAVYALGTLAGGARRGRLIANAGPIELDFDDGSANAAIPHNFHHHTQYAFTTQDVLNLQPQVQGGLDETSSLQGLSSVNVVSPVKGMNFVIVELSSLKLLQSIGTSRKPNPKLDDDWNVGFSGSYFYVITNTSDDNTYHIQTRMIEGVLEDPATGSAACALSCFITLNRHQRSRATRFQITQGVEMGRKSNIGVIVTLNDNLESIQSVELSGSAVKIMEGVVEY